ncbi:unnamed protein product [Parnassius apollo]|uniref:(apollo) hypothetical protein n=1 Tax=Parnassius apollo TaxID=110799 RepID=A0A8S3W7L3_PARAO|nr:unnamed protein product [Parnassius apollo]
MGEVEDQINECNMSNSEVTFDNFTILKEFSNLANLVRDEDFLEIVPKAKIRRVKWVPMFDCLKQGILDGMIQEITLMWQFENMPEKLDILEKLREHFTEINPDQKAWRPQHNDVKMQLIAHDMVNLQKEKTLLESLAKEYEIRVNRRKKNITAKRGYLKALQMDINKYQKINDDFISKIGEKIENHKNLPEKLISVKTNFDDNNWCESDPMEDE